MEERGYLQLLNLVTFKTNGQAIPKNTGQVHHSQYVFKPSMVCSRVDVLSSRKLLYSPQPLNRSCINDLFLNLGYADIVIERIFDETPVFRVGREESFTLDSIEKPWFYKVL